MENSISNNNSSINISNVRDAIRPQRDIIAVNDIRGT